MSDAEKTEAVLVGLDKLLKRLAVDNALLRKTRRLDDLMKEIPSLEAAKVNSSLGYVINCLYKSEFGFT